MRVKKSEEWVWSLDGETFFEETYPSKRAAVAVGLRQERPFFVGELKTYAPTLLGGEAVDAVVDLAIEELDEETVGDWLGDVSDEVLDALEMKLSLVFREWLRENGLEPNFQAVLETEEIHPEEARAASKAGAGSP